jgi:hypothetical protein
VSMIWLAPGAFVGLLLLAGPVAVHLLARRSARRLIFPATHFVPAMPAAAVTLRRPSDIGLLILRLAIVAAAVVAAAQPLVMTSWRLAGWNGRLSRAVVLDTSRSMAFDAAPFEAVQGGRDRPPIDVAAWLAEQEAGNVFAARRLDAPVLSDGIDRAIDWLQAVPPSRKEIVVISDFQRGAVDEGVLKGIPADVGVRLIRAGTPPETRRVESPFIDGWRQGNWQATTTIDAGGVRATWARRGDAAAPGWVSVAASSAEADVADRALRAAVALGIPAGDPGRRLLIRFAGAAALAPVAQPVHSPWIAAAAIALARSDLVPDADADIRVLERDGAMVVETPIPAAALSAPAVIRAALLAVRPAAIVGDEAEVVTHSDADLARWRRDPAPVTASAIPRADDSQGRWLWAVALLLLGAEARVRGFHLRAARYGGQAAARDTDAAA